MPLAAEPAAARLETLFAGGRPLAQLAILPARAHDPEPLLDTLDDRERHRAEGFTSPDRRTEYITSRWLLRQLQVQGPSSLSHCHRWLAAVATPGSGVGLDVESRLPRHREAVAERLGWGELAPLEALQAWTLWEAWRKLERGSVLDEPDLNYALVLREAPHLFDGPRTIAGDHWWSLSLEGAVLSGVVRP